MGSGGCSTGAQPVCSPRYGERLHDGDERPVDERPVPLGVDLGARHHHIRDRSALPGGGVHKQLSQPEGWMSEPQALLTDASISLRKMVAGEHDHDSHTYQDCDIGEGNCPPRIEAQNHTVQWHQHTACSHKDTRAA